MKTPTLNTLRMVQLLQFVSLIFYLKKIKKLNQKTLKKLSVDNVLPSFEKPTTSPNPLASDRPTLPDIDNTPPE